MQNFLRLIKYLLPFKGLFILACLFMLVNSLCKVALPWMMKELIDNLSKKDIFLINLIVVQSLGIAIFLGISRYGQSLFLNLIGEKIIFEIRCEVFNHLMDVSMNFYGKRKKGEIISRITNDVLLLKNFFSEEVISLIKNPVIIVVSLGILFYIHWKMTLFALIVAPLVMKIIIKFGKRMGEITLSCQRRLADLTGLTSETMHNIKTVKLFVREGKEKERFKNKNLEYFSLMKKNIKLMALSAPLVELLGTIAIIVLCGYGAYQVIEGNLTTGKLVAFFFYIGTISGPIKAITKANLIIQQAISSGIHIFEIIDDRDFIREKKGAMSIEIKEGRIKIENLSFAYDTDIILSDINLEIKPGETIGIVGQSGSGKTTLANLIVRLYEPTSGEITIDGYNISEFTISSLRQQIGFVPQEPVLFSGTIKENIGYGMSLFSDEQIKEASKLAHCHDFIMSLPDKYDTDVGEYGLKLSSGQKQRIAIARALILEPKIFILDEATSNLDYESERAIVSAISEISSLGTTMLVIAHRFSTLIHSDRIIAIDRGRIIKEGAYEELIEKDGLPLYEKLYKS
ncbi:TPA: ABC transporter ATP-binding protein [bacterium]|nr:ABC transporter ATP-binding protein [bacterium]